MHIERQPDVLKAPPGRHRADTGLWLIASQDGRHRRWVLRYTRRSTGKPTELGLGNAELVTLAEAREKALGYRKAIARGDDPIELKREARRNKTTFGDMVEAFIAAKQPGWRSAKQIETMRRLLTNHASPLANKSISAITADDVEATVRPLFDESVDQGKRTLSAISQVFEYAENKELISNNPADWRRKMKGRFFHKRGEPKNFKAMEYAEVPEFIRRLRHEQQYTTALSPHVIEFLVVTACRLSEVTGMRWVELDLDRKLWIIPAKRTKTNHVFWVPLSERAVALLRQQQKRSTGEFVWQTSKGKPIAQKTLYIHLTRRMKVSVTLHGFRASFRTWARNKMISTDEICELALAHRPGPVKRRYLRDEAVEERRIIMDAWAAFLG